MNIISDQKSRFYFIVIFTFVFPILFFLEQTRLSEANIKKSLSFYDPEYIHLYSGISLGKLELNVGHIDNPATPMQLLYAVVTRVTHVISGDGDYFTDVLSRSDYYLNIVDLVKRIIISLTLLFFGILVYFLTKDIFLTLLIQSAPFFNLITFTIFSRLLPETLFIIPVAALIYILLRFLKGNSDTLNLKELIFVALIGAFGLSIKLDFLPLLLIPVLIVGNLNRVVLYFSIVLTGFLIFAFPILFNLHFFTTWIKNLFLHSGKYGYGVATILDWTSVFQNLISLFKFYPVYFILFILSLASFITVQFYHKTDPKRTKIIVGFVISIIFHSFLVTKHFSFHYFLPAIFIFPFFLYLTINSLIPKETYRRLIFFGFILILPILTLKEYSQVMKWKIPIQKEREIVVSDARRIVGDSPFLIISQPYLAYFEESGLLFGWFFCGHLREPARRILENSFPDKLIYDQSTHEVFYWGKRFKVEELLERYDSLYVFTNKQVITDAVNIFEKFKDISKSESIYENVTTGDKIYLLKKIITEN